VVLLIIATLAALAWPKYKGIQEKALNREAKASLALIRAAEKIYRLEEGFYYPYSPPTTGVIADINSYLKLSLPEITPAIWTINLNTTTPTAEFGTAIRNPAANAGDGRTWTITFPGDDTTNPPTCSGSPNCS